MQRLLSYSFLYLVLTLLLSCSSDEVVVPHDVVAAKRSFTSQKEFSIAVIGSGIGGASFVHQIQRPAKDNIDITVYEKSHRLAGRVKKDTLGGGLIEQGATLIHSSNFYLQDIIANYHLEKSLPHGGEGEAETLAIWDGQKFRLNTSSNSLRSSMQMLWAYGLSLSKLSDAVKAIIPKWQDIYVKLSQDGMAYDSPEDLFRAIDLYELTQQTSYQFFKDQEVDDKLVYEFVDCISRVNYHQDGNINAFTDAVSLAGAGLDGGELFSVAGGNDKMVHAVLKNKSNVHLLLNEEVIKVDKLDLDGRRQYEVTSSNRVDTFDIVIVACPLESSDISIANYSLKRDREYQTVHAHFVSGQINYSYFNDVSNKPQTIFTIENEDIPFVSIAKTSYAPDWETPIYKIFSRDRLDDSFLSKIFTNIKGSTHQEWKAYPVLSPMSEWPPFKIDEGLYYINAMESAVSAMETQAVAASNVTNLCLEFMQKQ